MMVRRDSSSISRTSRSKHNDIDNASALIVLSSALLLSGLIPAASALTIDWTRKPNPDEKVLLPQCEDLTFALSGSHNILKFKKKSRYKTCNFNQSTTMLGVRNNGEYAITGDTFLKRKKYYYGCDFFDHCNTINMTILVEVIPNYTPHMNVTCVAGSNEPMLTAKVPDISKCEAACNLKDECMGFEFDPQNTKNCKLFDFIPAPAEIIEPGTEVPSQGPSGVPTDMPAAAAQLPETIATVAPSSSPSTSPSQSPTATATTSLPTSTPSASPSLSPSAGPTQCIEGGGVCAVGSDIPCCLSNQACIGNRCVATDPPTSMPSSSPRASPTDSPSSSPTVGPTEIPSDVPSSSKEVPSSSPTTVPLSAPVRCIAAGERCTVGGDPCCLANNICADFGTTNSFCVVPPTASATNATDGGDGRRVQSNANALVRRSSRRAQITDPIPGAVCYAGQAACPVPSFPHCTIDTDVSCTAFDDPSLDCKDAASLLPSNITASDIGTKACQLKLVYRYLITIKTTTASQTTWAMRIRKGGEPDVFARPREYDWLANGDILEAISGAGSVPFKSAEEVIVDFCKKETYKTMAESVVLTDGNTICTDRDQYKLTVKGL